MKVLCVRSNLTGWSIVALALTGCGSTAERPPDWRYLNTTPDFEYRYDLANLRHTETGNLIVKVRYAPTRPAPFTHSIATISVNCKDKRFAISEETTYNGSTVTGHSKQQPAYFMTAPDDSSFGHIIYKHCSEKA